MGTFNKAVTRNFMKPDERRDFKGHGHLDVLTFATKERGDLMIGKGVFEPGWKWSTDVKPIAGTDSCTAEHFGYCLKGTMKVKMDSGEEYDVKPGEAYYLAPGHDAWVTGDEACELLDFTGYAEYAKPKAEKAA